MPITELFTTSQAWQILTHLGASSLLLPVIALLIAGLWQSRQIAALRIWLAGILTATALTLATKILYMGWGIGIPSLDFTGISGHTLLATSVLPLLSVVSLGAWGKRSLPLTALLGLLLGAGVGISRIALDTHSNSEVVLGWLLGAAISYGTLRLMDTAARPPAYVKAIPLLLLLAFNTAASTYLPSHALEVRAAMLLSGRDTPHARQWQSHRRPENPCCPAAL